MRLLLDITEPEIDALNRMADERGSSRASLLREAVREYLERRDRPDRQAAFGLWSRAAVGEDGVAYQRRLRAEW